MDRLSTSSYTRVTTFNTVWFWTALYLRTLCDMNVESTMVLIPGHCGIPHHDLADHTAKKAIKAAADNPTSELLFDACKKIPKRLTRSSAVAERPRDAS